MTDYNIDNHKLMYHPKRVSDWLEDKQIYPIYTEISLTSACNHRCKFCAPKFFLDYKPEFLNTEVLKKTIKNMSDIGVKSIMFGGEGEPLLHKDFISIAKYTKECGIDIALTTNGVLFNSKMANELLPILSWIKFSVDSGDGKIYANLHGTKESDLKLVLDNISRASFIKRLKGYNVNIGVQAILFKDNIESLYKLAKILKYLKPDYFVVKPYSPHEKTKDNALESPTKEQINSLLKEMIQYKANYEFIYRDIAFSNLNSPKDYDFCYAQYFIGHIDTLGNVHSCVNYIDDPNYIYGNIYKDSFENIWKNRQIIKPDLNKCRTICRGDVINRYLDALKNDKVKHRNFI